jgi:exonuclease SbcD
MAKPPTLLLDGNEDWKIKGSFASGRYRFGLQAGAETLLREQLGYHENDTLPWNLFRALIFAGDAWLPNEHGSVEMGDDLVEPERNVELSDRDAKHLAGHLRGKRFSETQREGLERLMSETLLGKYLTSDDLQATETWVEEMAELVRDQSPDEEGISSGKDSSDSILHIGRATLGRRNMGRSERAADYTAAFEQAIDVAVENDVTAVVQTGGLFQSRSPSRATIGDCRGALERLDEAGIPFYLVYGRQEMEASTNHLKELQEADLVSPIGGRSVEVGDRTQIHGVDAGTLKEAAQDSQSLQPSEQRIVICAVGGADASAPESDVFKQIEEAAEAEPDLYLCGRGTSPTWSTRNDTSIIDPGATENVLSKNTFDTDPTPCGCYEYTVTQDSFSVDRHEIATRSFATIDLNMTPDTEIEQLKKRLSWEALSDNAVLAKLEGTKSPGSLSRESVQAMLTEHSYCARVYDNRRSVDEAASSAYAEIPLVEKSAEYLDVLEQAAELDLDTLSQSELVDLYAICSRIRSEADSIRKASRDEIADAIDDGETAEGSVGSVSGHRRESYSVKGRGEVLGKLAEHGIKKESVLSRELDTEKVEELATDSSVDLDKTDLFERSISEYVTREELRLSRD